MTRRWSAPDAAEALCLARAGVPDAQIAEHFVGRTVRAIVRFRHARGIKLAGTPRDWTARERRELIHLQAQGKSNAEMAQHFGRTERAVVSFRERQGIPARRDARRFTPEVKREIAAMKAAGATKAQIAAHLGRTPLAIQRFFRRERRKAEAQLPFFGKKDHGTLCRDTHPG